MSFAFGFEGDDIGDEDVEADHVDAKVQPVHSTHPRQQSCSRLDFRETVRE